MKKTIYVVYAVDTEGYVSELGKFYNLSDLKIRVSIFSPGTVITIEQGEEND